MKQQITRADLMQCHKTFDLSPKKRFHPTNCERQRHAKRRLVCKLFFFGYLFSSKIIHFYYRLAVGFLFGQPAELISCGECSNQRLSN